MKYSYQLDIKKTTQLKIGFRSKQSSLKKKKLEWAEKHLNTQHPKPSEKYKSKLLWDFILHLSEWLKSAKQMTGGKDVE